MVEDVFPAPPPAEPDPRACHLAVRMVNRKPLATDFSPPAALDILVVDTGVPSPPASLLSSQTLLSTPMMRDAGEGFLSVSAARGRRTTPSELTILYTPSVAMAPTNSFGVLSTVSLENLMAPKGERIPPPTSSSLQALVDDTYGAFFGPNKGTPLQ